MNPSTNLTQCGEVRLNKLAVNLVAIPLTLFVLGIFMLSTLLLPHGSKTMDTGLLLYLILVIPLAFVHEATHGFVAVKVGGVKYQDLKFGIMWKALMPYCHYRVPMSIKVYRRVTLAPLYVTGLITITFWLICPTFGSAMLAGTALGACIGDVWIFFRLKRFDGQLLVKDHPTEVGCDIFTEAGAGAEQLLHNHAESSRANKH